MGKKEIDIKITNTKQLINILQDINDRAKNILFDSSARDEYRSSIETLIIILQQSKYP